MTTDLDAEEAQALLYVQASILPEVPALTFGAESKCGIRIILKIFVILRGCQTGRPDSIHSKAIGVTENGA
jgi:hypothetical protein